MVLIFLINNSHSLQSHAHNNFQMNERKKSVQSTRHKYRKTSVVIYGSFKIFSILRSKTLKERFFMLGICILYSRILDITKDIADRMLQQYERDEIFLSKML